MNKWDWYWRICLAGRRGKCWFVGHEEAQGDIYHTGDPDYCPKCFIEWPQDKMELPKYLNRIYVWFVTRDWRWFNRLDEWLIFKHSKWLPRWWEY